ncbi:hypothetical protein TIFTF001_051006 [Ficus carica]|uniref:DUF8040 domain-containing protein n=1 Tax=Ficus carica TaxID=3494 RepID=A0AA87YQ95_FICCA|nr:hypothetical protein TIFTF001_051003 [Ficus carica]GMN20253.1 hypothetical protein TIFTF001_051006 [Ficus carica]
MNRFGSTPRHDENVQAAPNEQGEDDDMVARAVVAMINSRRNRRRVPQPMHDSILTGSMRVEEILNGHQDVIQGMISMKSSTFRALSNLLGSRELLTPTNHMNVNEQLFIFLAICSQGATNRHVSYLFQHSQETTSRWFFRVLKVICALKDEFIRPPDYTTVQPLIIEHEGKYRPWFDIGDQFLEDYVADCVPVRGNDDVNVDYVLDEGVDDTGPSIGTEQHGSSTGAMNHMRERMADAMWERYQMYPWYRAT